MRTVARLPRALPTPRALLSTWGVARVSCAVALSLLVHGTILAAVLASGGGDSLPSAIVFVDLGEPASPGDAARPLGVPAGLEDEAAIAPALTDPWPAADAVATSADVPWAVAGAETAPPLDPTAEAPARAAPREATPVEPPPAPIDPRDERVAVLELERQALQEEVARLGAERVQLHEQLAREREETARHAAAHEAAAAQLSAAQERAQALEAERAAGEAAAAELRATYEALVAALRGEIAQRDVELRRVRRGLSVSIVDRVLFPSGQATLTPEGREVITRVARALAAAPAQRLVIEGHTDDVPIGPALRARFPSNWELSTARATEVVRHLIDGNGLSPARIGAVGRADTDPVATNATEEGRRLNRRIEIIVLPPEPRATDS